MSKKAYERKTDEELLRSVAEHEEGIFDELVRRHQEFLTLYCHRILNNYDEAADAANRVWIRLWSRSSSLASITNFKSYLAVTARNICVDITRSRLRLSSIQEEQMPSDSSLADPAPSPESNLMVEETLQILKGHVPEADLEILMLRFYYEMDASEIGHALGIPSATIRKRIQRSLDKLRSTLEEE